MSMILDLLRKAFGSAFSLIRSFFTRSISHPDSLDADEQGTNDREFLWGFFRKVRESSAIFERDMLRHQHTALQSDAGDEDQALEADRRPSNLLCRVAQLAVALLRRLLMRTFPRPDTLSGTEEGHGFGTLGRPLPRSAMEDWKWYTDWRMPWRTPAQQRRTECARQPTIQQCLVEVDPATGQERRHAIPRVRTPSPSHAPNDYDRLLDTRVLSPNNKAVAFFDWDREEIERENAFTPPLEAASPVLSPVPEEGSLSAMIRPSLVDRPHNPWPPGRGHYSASEVRQGEISPLAGLSQEQRQNVLPRFRTLPLRQQLEIQYKRSQLAPTQREIYDRVKALQASAKELLKGIKVDSEEIKHDFWISIIGELPADSSVEVESLLGIFHRAGEEAGLGLNNNGVEIRRQQFWLAVLQLVDDKGAPTELRQHVAQKLLHCKREDFMTCLTEDIDDWLGGVGDRGKELRGIYKRGDFWRSVLKQWEEWLETAQTTYCIVEDEEAGCMSIEVLRDLMEAKIPVQMRAWDSSAW